MLKKFKIIMVVVVGALLVVSSQVASFAMSDAQTGFLSDALCANNGKSAGGVNLLESPEKHTKGCMLMPPCVKSGYGVFMKDGAGRYAFFNFDDNGTKLAKALLDQTEKSDNISIKVTGKLVGNTFMVTDLIES